MTQRGAVFVGCRLIAIYLVVEAAIATASSLFNLGFMLSNMPNMPNGRMGMAGMPLGPVFQSLLLTAFVRGGVAILLWAAAARISRLAAEPADGDDGWHGE